MGGGTGLQGEGQSRRFFFAKRFLQPAQSNATLGDGASVIAGGVAKLEGQKFTACVSGPRRLERGRGGRGEEARSGSRSGMPEVRQIGGGGVAVGGSKRAGEQNDGASEAPRKKNLGKEKLREGGKKSFLGKQSKQNNKYTNKK